MHRSNITVERGKGGRYHRNNVNYEVECQLCEGEKAVYYGETFRNLYTRSVEHQKANRLERNREESDDEGFMRKHMRECHEG